MPAMENTRAEGTLVARIRNISVSFLQHVKKYSRLVSTTSTNPLLLWFFQIPSTFLLHTPTIRRRRFPLMTSLSDDQNRLGSQAAPQCLLQAHIFHDQFSEIFGTGNISVGQDETYSRRNETDIISSRLDLYLVSSHWTVVSLRHKKGKKLVSSRVAILIVSSRHLESANKLNLNVQGFTWSRQRNVNNAVNKM